MAAASSSSTSTMTSPFDSLPDELLLKIMKFAAEPPKDNGRPRERNKGRTMAEMGEKYNHEFLANRISKVSTRFRRVVADESLWKGAVWIGPRSNLVTIEFVCRECLNGGTTAFHMPGNLSCDDYWYISGGRQDDRWLQYVDPHTRFPNLKVSLGEYSIGRGSVPVDMSFLDELRRRLLTPSATRRSQDEGSNGWERSRWRRHYGWTRKCCYRHSTYGYRFGSECRDR